jgi:TolB-like protein/class 3 adenylate cyclase/Tfp pilus assembly protein PilF
LSERVGEAVRRLTAIMFTDMVGYTAMVQDDEQQALQLRDRWREVLQRRIGASGGTLLQTYGDGSLSIFDSAIAAVECAIAIQRDLNSDPAVPLRIGIHTGDIVYDADSVFGDGVNVASRLQSLATPGSVLLSGKVYDEIKNQRGLAAESLGEFDLKNVRRPIEVFAVLAEGIARPELQSLAASRAHTERRSVAVLPFANLSIDPENEVFSDGITEELINALTRVNGLQVTARTSSFAFKGLQTDVREIANRLGVGTVLEGSVRKDGERVRITAQLIDARSGYHLFSETYDRRIADIFQTQDEIARAIVTAVHSRLAPEDRGEPLVPARTDSAAHAVFLKGLREFNRWAPENQRAAIAYFQKAIRLDALYAPAYRGLAMANLVLASYGLGSATEAYRESEAAAKRAAELDANDGEAHATLGLVRLFSEWNTEAAYVECQKALGMSPGSARVRHAYSILLLAQGEAARAVEEMEAAVRLDPLSPVMLNALGNALFSAGRFEDALRAQGRAIELDPTFRAAVDSRGWIHVLQRRYEEAGRDFERSLEITGDPYKGLALRGLVAARLGRPEETQRALDMLRERRQRSPGLSHDADFLLLHHALGEMEEAFRYLRALVSRRSVEALFMPHDPHWRLLLAQQDFRTVMARHGHDLGSLFQPTEKKPPGQVAVSPPRVVPAASAALNVPANAGLTEHDGKAVSLRDQDVLFGIFGALKREGSWTPAQRNIAIVFLGGGTIDLREATLVFGVTEIDAFVFLGGLEIIVPPNVIVDCSGTAIAGAFVETTPAAKPPAPNAPVVRVGGLVLLGGVTIHVRYPGETEEAANERIRGEGASFSSGQ